ncbi:MAG: DUF4287 domain-containing protein [Bacteroidetes bacterium]|nr:DUF4287 domain-containing protein [Bacteroidota bacterium]
MEPALKTMIDNMPAKTGKSLTEWKAILKEANLAKHGEMLKLLKGEYGVSHGFANTIASLYRQDDAPEVDLVAEQYKAKEKLLPIYTALMEQIEKLGDDLKIVPKKTSVSIIRKKQFLLLKPATKTRLDLGFKFKNRPLGERLAASGPFGTMCSHRVCLSTAEEVDEELITWMKEAYEESV